MMHRLRVGAQIFICYDVIRYGTTTIVWWCPSIPLREIIFVMRKYFCRPGFYLTSFFWKEEGNGLFMRNSIILYTLLIFLLSVYLGEKYVMTIFGVLTFAEQGLF